MYIYNYIQIWTSIYNLLARYLQFYTSHSKCRFFIPTGFYRVNYVTCKSLKLCSIKFFNIQIVK